MGGLEWRHGSYNTGSLFISSKPVLVGQGSDQQKTAGGGDPVTLTVFFWGCSITAGGELKFINSCFQGFPSHWQFWGLSSCTCSFPSWVSISCLSFCPFHFAACICLVCSWSPPTDESPCHDLPSYICLPACFLRPVFVIPCLCILPTVCSVLAEMVLLYMGHLRTKWISLHQCGDLDILLR